MCISRFKWSLTVDARGNSNFVTPRMAAHRAFLSWWFRGRRDFLSLLVRLRFTLTMMLKLPSCCFVHHFFREESANSNLFWADVGFSKLSSVTVSTVSVFRFVSFSFRRFFFSVFRFVGFFLRFISLTPAHFSICHQAWTTSQTCYRISCRSNSRVILRHHQGGQICPVHRLTT